MSQIGGSATQTFYDDGTNGDLVAGDGIYSFQAFVAAATALDTSFNFTATIADVQSRTGQAVISLRTGNDRIFGGGFEGP